MTVSFLQLIFFVFSLELVFVASQNEIFGLAENGNVVEIAELLATNPHAVGLRNDLGFTPLLIAAAHGHREAVSFLLENGANVNEVENDRWTSLMFAAHAGDVDLCRILLVSGADPLRRNHKDRTAFEIAQAENKAEAAREIGEDTVRYAITFGNLEEMMIPIRQGVDLHVQNVAGWSPLIAATVGKSLPVVQELIQMGADVHQAEDDGWTPIVFAAHYGQVAIADELIKAGANVNYLTHHHHNPLQQAIAHGHEEMKQLLQAHGAVLEKDGEPAAPSEGDGEFKKSQRWKLLWTNFKELATS